MVCDTPLKQKEIRQSEYGQKRGTWDMITYSDSPYVWTSDHKIRVHKNVPNKKLGLLEYQNVTNTIS